MRGGTQQEKNSTFQIYSVGMNASFTSLEFIKKRPDWEGRITHIKKQKRLKIKLLTKLCEVCLPLSRDNEARQASSILDLGADDVEEELNLLRRQAESRSDGHPTETHN